jgi:branched-subunit amino acid transport protein
MDQKIILLTIVGMMVVTYVPRFLPALALSSRNLPPVLTRWLSYVPSAVLSALLFPSLLIHEGAIDFSFSNLFLWAAVPSFAVMFLTRSFFGTVATGMVVVAAVRYFIS